MLAKRCRKDSAGLTYTVERMSGREQKSSINYEKGIGAEVKLVVLLRGRKVHQEKERDCGVAMAVRVRNPTD